MTRARDTLTIYAKQGTGKDSTPAGFLRELLKDATLHPFLQKRTARPLQVDLFAQEEAVPSLSNASQWLAMDAGLTLTTGLSASAVEIYELCPLKFKLEREWRIPRDVPAAMQYGAAMHRVLRTLFESIRLGRPVSPEHLMELFKADLASANLEDPYQHELYETQGLRQLAEFLAVLRAAPGRDVLHTEESFSLRMGSATVAGRIDRIDRIVGNRVAIVDYKTGKPRSQEDADSSLQLSIYAVAAEQTWGYKAERLIFYNLEDNTTVSTSRSEQDLLAAKAKVEEVAQKIAAGEFGANEGFHCGFCSYRNLCPAKEKKLYASKAKKKAALIQ
jgi:RecB family exonuclease